MICDENAREARQKQAEENLESAGKWKAEMTELRKQWGEEKTQELKRKAQAATDTTVHISFFSGNDSVEHETLN